MNKAVKEAVSVIIEMKKMLILLKWAVIHANAI